MIVLMSFLAILATQVDDSHCCGCYLVRHQNSFCRADFAIKVNVTNVIIQERNRTGYELDRDFIFTVDIMDVFKSSAITEISNQTSATVVSHASPGMCPVLLTKGTVYYLSGFIIDRNLTISSCSATSEYSQLTETQLEGIQGLYAKNCRCRLNSLLLEPRWRRKRVCNADVWSVCEDKNAVCRRARKGRCILQYKEGIQSCD